jgi:hypothetical protein
MGLSKILPQALTEQARIWADAFRISVALNPHEKDALDFLKEMQDAAIDRNRLPDPGTAGSGANRRYEWQRS